ncbi:metal-dependent hydrolase, partial [Citrobacter sp. AAK_AS5]
MPELKIRKIDFQFGDDIPFQFNPNNLYWSNFVNYISLIGPAFERYFIRA